jgi:DNA-binding beta-propeller fold protein YncE
MCYGIAFSPDGRTAWVGSHLDGIIYEYDAATGRQISSVQSPVPYPRKMATAPSGTNQYYLYVASYGGLYAYGPLPSANPSWTLLADIRGDAVRYSREGNAHYLYATSISDRGVVKLAVSGANVTQVWVSNLGSPPLDVDIAPAVNEVLVAFYGGTIKRLRASDGAVLSPDFIGSPLGGIEYVGIAVAPIPGRTVVHIIGYWPYFYTYERQPDGSGAPADWPMQPVYLTGRKSGYAIVIGPRWNPIVRCPEDITGDGVVDDADLLRVLFAFGTSCQ